MRLDESTAEAIRKMLDDEDRRRDIVYVAEADDVQATKFRDDAPPLQAQVAKKRVLRVRQFAAPMPWTGTEEMAYRWYVAVDDREPDVPLVHGTPKPVQTGHPWWDPAVKTLI